LQEFDKPIPQKKLDIFEKTRSNLFAWRGQFSPQLIEIILSSYCLPNSVVLDPFVGSGTVLLEASIFGFETYSFEINPAAWILSKTYELINENRREKIIADIRNLIDREFPFIIFKSDSQITDLPGKLSIIKNELDEAEKNI
jgi:site-specific DNA-adenine methylase